MSEDLYVKKCLLLIEEELNWGSSANWANYDFEKLSTAIEERTGVVLSITTLKRIWGKVKYNHSPTLTTLNTLARFLNFEDWRSFVQSCSVNDQPLAKEPEEQTIDDVKSTAKPIRKLPRIVLPVVTGLILLGVATFFIFSKQNIAGEVVNSDHFQFRANKVMTDGVPNSVVFTYDASAAKTDSIYIVQTWDIRRKTLVSKSNNKHSAIYYYPGFFRTKLIADNSVVKTHDLQINTSGWLCLVENDPVPLYFKKEDFQKDGKIEIDSSTLHKYNLSLSPSAPKIRFFNQKDMGALMNDNFVFETTIKNKFDGGSNSCQFVQVLIQCKDDIIIIPLSAKACIGDISLYAAGKQLVSKEADLSGFGADLSQWTTLKVEAINKRMSFFVNGKLAASLVFPNDPSGIVGLQYRFNGMGAVQNTWFENKNGKIIMD